MSGAWARACDGWPTNSHKPPEVMAVYWLSEALLNRGEAAQREAVETAGAYMRAWRKSLPEQGERWPDFVETEDPTLLWMALRTVCSTQVYPHFTAREHRVAEAALRTWWKRHRGEEEQP